MTFPSNLIGVSTWPEDTTGLCPTCLRPVPARLTESGGAIWLESVCALHGPAKALLASDSAEYSRLRMYVPARARGCCGGAGCSTAGPPVCVLLIEITTACNLRCPTCFVDAGGHDELSLSEIQSRLDAFFRQHSHLDVLMLSGGEPTMHRELTRILDLALTYPIERVLVNTNGIRLASDDGLLDVLSAHRRRLELYLSFSSFRPEVHERLYGLDLRDMKQRAIKRSGDAGLLVNLVATVEQGANDDEIGDLYRFALSQECINGVIYQPVMHTGRYEHAYDPERRLNLTGVLRELERQTNGALRSTDFAALPCSHPDCCALTYGVRSKDRKALSPLPRYIDVARYIDLFSDRMSFSGLTGSALRRVWSDVAHLRAVRTLRDLAFLYSRSGVRELIPLILKPDEMARRIFRVVVKPFMDASTYDMHRTQQCCTRILDEHGQAISLCEHNVRHRGQARSGSVDSGVLCNTGPG